MSATEPAEPHARTDDALYGYIPSKAATIIFVSLFLVSTVIHCVQAIKYRKWYLIYTAGVCGMLEFAGWIGRLWSAFSPQSMTAYKLQATCLVFAPTPLLAATFVIFGQIIKRLGPSFSRLQPKRCKYQFELFLLEIHIFLKIQLCFDVLALVVQGGGGGIAASATDNPSQIDLGSRIMLVGIVVQLVVIIGFSVLAAEFLIRFYKNMPFQGRSDESMRKLLNTEVKSRMTPNIKLILYGVLLSTVFFLVRSIYRVIELSEGWEGPVMRTQMYFNIMDGLMIVLAMYTVNVFHPGRYLATDSKDTELQNIGD
ncbi:hypothetical protein JR316_0008346 [Psilocybe cubensis]|uniref:Uncharacterized protein n=1 Tax=Psilocybe cubensis TaxID=181762 RepID=A0ACB8GVV1_PSICU|nr:hypothetical protein JR316_0008346 [Psilocybe cubensis]KAH9479751.1 hypothetical protein JR316_0008346 [Psilocybe cubensis]